MRESKQEPTSLAEDLGHAFVESGGAAHVAPSEHESLKRSVAADELDTLKSQEGLNKDFRPRMIDGIGQIRLRVDQRLYTWALHNPQLKAIWGHNPWHNAKFRELVAREHPECVVRSRLKTRIVHPGFGGQELRGAAG